MEKRKKILAFLYDLIVMLVFTMSVCLISAQYIQNKELRKINNALMKRVNSYEEFFLHKELSKDTKQLLRKIRNNNRENKF